MRQVDLSVVTFQPDLALFGQLLASLAEPTREPLRRNLFIHDNSPDPQVALTLAALPELRAGGAFARVEVKRFGANLGFGRGHNANAALGSAPLVFVLNQDCILEPGVLEAAVAAAEADDARVGAWEMRQIPYEHPKEYDPVTLDTPWASGAALLLRRTAARSPVWRARVSARSARIGGKPSDRRPLTHPPARKSTPLPTSPS
ncbi:MAG: glycosyltransferase [Pseudomonadota bacterium]|nr:glycosyltransferase [Pseudomonadota bacterium]